MTTLVHLRDYAPLLRSLSLERTPIYLRFTIRDRGDTLDALDQLDDQAEAGETIIPAKMDGTVGTMFVDGYRDGRRWGERRTFADYVPVLCPLSQEQLADNEAWTKWCDEEYAKEHPEPKP